MIVSQNDPILVRILVSCSVCYLSQWHPLHREKYIMYVCGGVCVEWVDVRVWQYMQPQTLMLNTICILLI